MAKEPRKKQIPIPHIPLPFEAAVKEFLKVKPEPKKGLSKSVKESANLEHILGVRCPTCGAKPGEKCELGIGQPRNTPHRDRRLLAKER